MPKRNHGRDSVRLHAGSQSSAKLSRLLYDVIAIIIISQKSFGMRFLSHLEGAIQKLQHSFYLHDAEMQHRY